MKNPIVTIIMTNDKELKLELYPEFAPNTVNNFISLINNNFYNGLIFHRIIENFMIQGGCPQGIGIGNAGYNIKGEFNQNGFKNDLKHERGVISMARAYDMNSASSQFFIVHKNSPHLDGSYAAFGKLIDGYDVLDELASLETNYSNRPIDDSNAMIKTMIVDLNEYIFSEPEKI